MSTVPVANYRRIFHTEHDSYELNMTARKVDSMTPAEMSKLIISTVKLWLYLAKQIEGGIQELPESIAFKSAEMSVENETETELVQHHEPRVTVFDWNHRLELTVHSNSLPQPALELWYSMNDAQAELDKLYPRNAPKPAQEAATAVSSNIIQDKPATPKNAPVAPNSGNLYTKKDAIAKLNAGDAFKMKVVQIEKHSKDGKDFYDLYEPYGGKAGQYSSASVFTDNEIAINNGLIADLDKLGVQLGQALTGNWVLNCSVGKPKTKVVKGEEKTFTNIYVQSLEK